MKKIISALLVLIMVLSLCTAAFAEETKYAEWVYNGNFVDLDTADPYGGTSAQTESFTNMTFDTVVYNNPETGAIDPELAYKWEGNEDNTEWTFWLEENVYFHNLPRTPFVFGLA